MKPKPPVSIARWTLWWFLLAIGIFIFYVLLTPIWIGLRALAWVAEFRAATRGSVPPRAPLPEQSAPQQPSSAAPAMSVAAAEPRTAPKPALTSQARRKRRLAVRADPVAGRALAHRPDLRKLRADEVQRGVVVCGVPGGEAVLHELPVDGAPPLLAVVVGAGAPREQAEAVAHPLELRAERVGHAGLEPADHSGAHARQDRALLPRLAQQRVETVDAPDREHVRGVAAADDDHVLREDELRRSSGGQGKKSTRRTSARSRNASWTRSVYSGFSAEAVPTQRTRGDGRTEVENAAPECDHVAAADRHDSPLGHRARLVARACFPDDGSGST